MPDKPSAKNTAVATPTFVRRVVSSQCLEKSDQGGPFVRGHLCQQADDFQQDISGLLIVDVWPALFTIFAIIFPDQFLQYGNHSFKSIRRGVVSDCQHAAAFGANLGANWNVGGVWPLFYREFRTVIDGSQCRGREFESLSLHLLKPYSVTTYGNRTKTPSGVFFLRPFLRPRFTLRFTLLGSHSCPSLEQLASRPSRTVRSWAYPNCSSPSYALDPSV